LDSQLKEEVADLHSAIARAYTEDITPLKEMFHSLQHLHGNSVERLEKELAELRDESQTSQNASLKAMKCWVAAIPCWRSFKESQNEVNGRLTSEIQQVKQLLDATTNKQMGQLTAIEDTLESMKKQQMIFESQLVEDRTKTRGNIEQLQEKAESLFDSLAYSVAKLEKEVPESIQRSQSGLERKLSKLAEDIDEKLKEAYHKHEESLNTLKDHLGKTFQQDINTLHQETLAENARALKPLKDNLSDLQSMKEDLGTLNWLRADVLDLKDAVDVLFDDYRARTRL